MVIRPDMVGLAPRLIWKYWLRKTEAPNIATPTAMLATTARVMVRLRNSRSGMIGSLARYSTRTASTPRATAPVTMTALCQESQSYLSPARVTQISSSDTAAVIRVAPAQSIFTWRLTTGRCRVFWSTTRATMANGTPT